MRRTVTTPKFLLFFPILFDDLIPSDGPVPASTQSAGVVYRLRADPALCGGPDGPLRHAVWRMGSWLGIPVPVSRPQAA